ncbi:RNA-binding S4 domain-containing protein [Paracoccus benzoatiresistens]|uniref:RNA-binding S4 domain-containing protein n=1 Tax=Paracoccus benzoatiresistens TaxID=2997341 RepID=A0ABT4J6G9_9RHOB|nr:RNA-binding S4 domain-containing protein [Paracoccus sp. EF6]MCZ0962270.1 RNA-binding S4 domain-containing protein [Paracoccus sp. EF6]
MTDTPPGLSGGLRLDKWLFFARVFKSRAIAVERIEAGGVRVNDQPCNKPGKLVRPGDRIVVSAHGRVRALEITAIGHRRGPASEAQDLYHDLGAEG